jgi:tetratricopeptide (TPR) repeat protein
MIALVNFANEAIPAMTVFIIYASLLISRPKTTIKTSPGTKDRILSAINLFQFRYRIISAVAICIISVWVIVRQATNVESFKLLKASENLAGSKYQGRIMNVMAALEGNLSYSSIYLVSYGKMLFANKQYAKALNQFTKAKQITSDPELYLLIGNCFAKLNNNNEAINAYQLSKNIYPCLLMPRYQLMKLYVSNNDWKNAQSVAKDILTTRSKTNSPKTISIRKVAQEVLNYHSTNNIELNNEYL